MIGILPGVDDLHQTRGGSNVDHHVLMDLVAERLKDRKVLRLVSAFLRAGVVELRGGFAESLTGTPQGNAT